MTNSPEPSRPSVGPSAKSSAEAARRAAPAPMRSFRLYVRRPLFGANRREAADYAPEEAAAVERVFAAQVRARRRRGRVTAIFLAGTALAMLVPSDGFRALAMIFGGACVLVLHISVPALHCPGCTRGIEFGRGEHCSACGARDTLAPLPAGVNNAVSADERFATGTRASGCS